MADVSPEAIIAARRELGFENSQIPSSVAIIMDGNGRWARSQGLPRPFGHEEGARTVWKIVIESARLGLDALSLYSFSIENWNRPKEEVDALMQLYAHVLRRERPTVMSHNIKLGHLGRREGLPSFVLDELDESVEVSRNNTGMRLCLALNYASRAEINDAVVRIAKRVAAGEITPDQIDEAMISNSLDTADIPDPDLLIRTSGEIRLSNFLLWQLSYSEFYITDTHWPDFDAMEFQKALRAYARRHRRFGGLDDSNV